MLHIVKAIVVGVPHIQHVCGFGLEVKWKVIIGFGLMARHGIGNPRSLVAISRLLMQKMYVTQITRISLVSGLLVPPENHSKINARIQTRLWRENSTRASRSNTGILGKRKSVSVGMGNWKFKLLRWNWSVVARLRRLFKTTSSLQRPKWYSCLFGRTLDSCTVVFERGAREYLFSRSVTHSYRLDHSELHTYITHSQ